jgi:hypothetical protein
MKLIDRQGIDHLQEAAQKLIEHSRRLGERSARGQADSFAITDRLVELQQRTRAVLAEAQRVQRQKLTS